MRILDSDILTHLFEGTPRVVEALERAQDEVCTTIFNRIEVLRARFDFLLKASSGKDLLRAQSLLDRSVSLLNRFRTVGVNSNAAARFDDLRQNKKLRKIGRIDLLIASVALSRGAVIVTRNVRHFSLIQGLAVENWAQ